MGSEEKPVIKLGRKLRFFSLGMIVTSIIVIAVSVFVIYHNQDVNNSFICVNGFKSYPVGSNEYNNWNNIIPCEMNEFLSNGKVNSTMISYYENTFTGSTIKFFMLHSDVNFSIFAYEKASQNWVFVGSNNNEFLLDPNQNQTVQIVIENYSNIDPIETEKQSKGIITGWYMGFNPDYGKEVLQFNVDLGKPYIAMPTDDNPSYAENGNDGYAKIPINIISDKPSNGDVK